MVAGLCTWRLISLDRAFAERAMSVMHMDAFGGIMTDRFKESETQCT